MKHLALAAAVLATVFASADAATVTGADLYRRCARDRNVCDRAMTWIWTNTGACTDTHVKHADQVAQVIAWLKKHPTARGASDNDLAGSAIQALWPCHL
jgi:hypothetical protein